MKTSLKSLPAIILLAVMGCTLFVNAGQRGEWDRKADARKAEYLFLEGQNAYCLDEFGRYVNLTKRAFNLDSQDIDIAYEWAFITLANDVPDTIIPVMERAYNYVKRAFLEDPSNYYTGLAFAIQAAKRHRIADQLMCVEILDSIYPDRQEISDMLAETYIRAFTEGDTSALDKAIEIYNRAEAGTGKSVDISYKKIQAYSVKDDTAAIFNEIEELIQSAPADSYTAMFAGVIYSAFEIDDKALQYLDLACSLDSTNGSAFLRKAEYYMERGDSLAYDREVFHALKSVNLDVDSKVDILQKYISKLYRIPEQEPRIRQLFSELEQINAGEPQIHNLFGAYLFGIEDYPGAIEQFSYSVALDPADEGNWTTLVQVAGLSSDTLALEQYSREAWERFPDNLYFPLMQMSALSMSDRIPEAIAVVDSIDFSDVENLELASSMIAFKGDMLAAAGDTINALETYDKALLFNPDNAMAMNNAAYFMTLRGGDLDKAERLSSRSLAIDPMNATYMDTYAWVLFKKNNFSLARQYIDMAINQYTADGEDESVNYEIYDHAGDIYFMIGDKDTAVQFWQKALDMEPDNELLQRKVRYRTIFSE